MHIDGTSVIAAGAAAAALWAAVTGTLNYNATRRRVRLESYAHDSNTVRVYVSNSGGADASVVEFGVLYRTWPGSRPWKLSRQVCMLADTQWNQDHELIGELKAGHVRFAAVPVEELLLAAWHRPGGKKPHLSRARVYVRTSNGLRHTRLRNDFGRDDWRKIKKRWREQYQSAQRPRPEA